jgi:hypothetical protein
MKPTTKKSRARIAPKNAKKAKSQALKTNWPKEELEMRLGSKLAVSFAEFVRDHYNEKPDKIFIGVKFKGDLTPKHITIRPVGKWCKTSAGKLSELDKARAEAQAAEERRRHESMQEKLAIRSALISRQSPLDRFKANESKAREREEIKTLRKAVAAEHRELKKLARAREREELKELKRLDRARQREQAKATGSKNQPRGNR